MQLLLLQVRAFSPEQEYVLKRPQYDLMLYHISKCSKVATEFLGKQRLKSKGKQMALRTPFSSVSKAP